MVREIGRTNGFAYTALAAGKCDDATDFSRTLCFRHCSESVNICRQTPRHSEQTFADRALMTARFAIRGLPQKEHLPFVSGPATIIEPPAVCVPSNVPSAMVTHELQIKTF